MANFRDLEETERIKQAVMLSCARLFLMKGYSNTSVKEIAAGADIHVSKLMHIFGSKEEMLCCLVEFVFKEQIGVTKRMLDGKSDDGLLVYAAETTLQLYMAESDENIRDLYSAAYSMPKSAELIQTSVAVWIEQLLKEYMPGLTTKDFYELEIASGSIMRGFMMKPCNMYFTIEHKVDLFIDSVLRLYRIPEENIQQAKQFVRRFDYKKTAQSAIETMLTKLENIETV